MTGTEGSECSAEGGQIGRGEIAVPDKQHMVLHQLCVEFVDDGGFELRFCIESGDLCTQRRCNSVCDQGHMVIIGPKRETEQSFSSPLLLAEVVRTSDL